MNSTVLPRVNAHLISSRNVRLFEVLIVNFFIIDALPQILAHVLKQPHAAAELEYRS